MKLEDLLNWGVDLEDTLPRFVNDKEFYISCLNSFVKENKFEALAKALEAKDYKKAFDASHSIKGVVGNLGLKPLYKDICVLVENLRKKQYDNLNQEYQQVLIKRDEFLQLMK